MYLKNLPPLHTPGPFWRFAFLHCTDQLPTRWHIWFVFCSPLLERQLHQGVDSCLSCSLVPLDGTGFLPCWNSSWFSETALLERLYIRVYTHTYTQRPPPLSFANCQRTLWLLELLSCQGGRSLCFLSRAASDGFCVSCWWPQVLCGAQCQISRDSSWWVRTCLVRPG